MIVGKQLKYLFINKSDVKYMLVEIAPKIKNPNTYINLYLLNESDWTWKFQKQIEIKHKVSSSKKNVQAILPIIGWALYYKNQLPNMIPKGLYAQYEKEYWAYIRSELIEDESITPTMSKEYFVR